VRDFLTVLGHRYDAGVKALLWTVGLDELPCFGVLSDQPGRRVASTHIGAQGKPIRELAPITTECKDTSAGIRDGIRPPRRGRATAPMAPRPAARGAPDDRWGSPSRACLNVGSSAARLHQSIVHTGRAIDTCDVEIGPRYRLSQLFGTRVLTSQSSSAPTSRPHAACGNARPGCRRRRPSCWEDGDRDGHRLGSDLHYIAGEGNDRLEHRLYAAAAWESTQATIHVPRVVRPTTVRYSPRGALVERFTCSPSARITAISTQAIDAATTARMQSGCTPSDTGRAARVPASHEVPRKGCALRLRPM